MLMCSRLLGLLLISAISVPALTDEPQTDPTAPAATSQSVGKLPFNPDKVPTATASTTPLPPPAPVVESEKMSFSQCDSETHLQKSVLIMAFPQVNPTDANAGDLYKAEYQLPGLLSQQLMLKGSITTPIQVNEALNNDSNEIQRTMQTQRMGTNYRSQIIVSGEILDMAMTNPEATYNPGLYRRFINGLYDVFGMRSFDKRDRFFSFQIHLRDGFTGQQLFTKRYDTFGIWDSNKKVGFGTPLFWASDYGQQVKGLVKMASDEVNEAISCQPFIAHIDSRPGQTQIILQGGANNGLHAGDTLALYQMVVQGSETRYQEHDVRLVNRNAAIELREVYPSHSVGVINSSSFLNGQFLALAP